MNKRVLVTGARGFVGRILCERLEVAGHTVLASDLGSPEASDDYFPCDVTDSALIERLFDWAGDLTHAVHLAAITYLPEVTNFPTRAMEVNHLGAMRFSEALVRRFPDALMLYIGSSEAYGKPHMLPVTEEHPLCPLSAYAISKAAADHYCRYLSEEGRGRIVRVRPFNHTGPGQTERFALPSFASQIARIEAGDIPPVIHVGNLEASRDFSDVLDVVSAYEMLLDEGEPGEAYNVCSGESVSIRAALETLLEASQADIEVRVDPDRLRAVDVPEVRGSYAKIESATGWKPATSIEITLLDLLDSHRKRLAETAPPEPNTG